MTVLILLGQAKILFNVTICVPIQVSREKVLITLLDVATFLVTGAVFKDTRQPHLMQKPLQIQKF